MSPFWNRPSHAEKMAAAAAELGLDYQAQMPALFGRVRADARGHSVREIAHVVRGTWKEQPLTAFEAGVGIEPDRSEWWVVMLPVPAEGTLLTVHRRNGLITVVYRDEVMQPCNAPAQASESEELRRQAQRLEIWPTRIACDDDYHSTVQLPIHIPFIMSVAEPWTLQIDPQAAWVTVPKIDPAQMAQSFDRAVSLVDQLDILRRPYS